MIKLGRPVKDIVIEKDTDIEEIFSELQQSGGFESRNLAEGLDILSSMISDKKCLKFLSFVGAIVSTGLRGIIKDMIKNKWFDVVITTCGALDHDIARYYSNYNEGSFTIEEKVQSFLEEAYKEGKREISTAEISKIIGKHMGKNSFLYWAYKNDIPVIVPGIMDGAVGSQVWVFTPKHHYFHLNIITDSEILSELIFKAKKSGALMLGGGISKHHTLWWNQYREGLDYALYITTAQEFDGSLSGALVREAISWGKVTQKAKQSTIHAEATTILPFLYAALLSKLKHNL